MIWVNQITVSKEGGLLTPRRETLSAQLVRAVSERIQSGHYRRGDRLPTEKELIDEFGVSRTVVREAIANLRASGMVSTHQGIGAFVMHDTALPSFRIAEDTLLVIEEVVRALELRIAIESEAAALAAMRRSEADVAALRQACDEMDKANIAGETSIQTDLEFHRAVARSAHNDQFLKIFNYLGEVLIPRTRLQTHKFDTATLNDYIARINDEHRQILSAIEKKDPDGARAAMRLHLGGSRDRLLALVKQ